MSGGHFDYAYQKVEDFNHARELIVSLREMRDWSITFYPRAVIYIEYYLLFLEDMERRYYAEGEKIAELMQAIEWHASGDSGVDDVIEVLDCINILGLTP